MVKVIMDPLSGSHRVEGHEHLGSYTDKKSAREAYRNERKKMDKIGREYAKLNPSSSSKEEKPRHYNEEHMTPNMRWGGKESDHPYWKKD